MAGWAPSHGASEDVQSVAGRIAVAERDDAALLRNWLRERREAVPDTDASRRSDSKAPPGADRTAELAQLDSALGAEFDSLFLTFVIRHDQSELAAMNQLFASPGAGQGAFIFTFASDLSAEHTAEIGRMRALLTTRGLGGDSNP